MSDSPMEVVCCLAPTHRCNHVDCQRCPSFLISYPEAMWICAECVPWNDPTKAPLYNILPYWSDGDCQICGRYSIVRTGVLINAP